MPSLFDLHCDTAYEMYKGKQGLAHNTLGIDIEKFDAFENKAQIFAIWSDESLTDDEVYVNFKHVSAEFHGHINENIQKISLCTTAQEIKTAQEQDKIAALLSVEDARLLGNDLSRLETLYNEGVRIITLCWKGMSVIGGGYDTDEGLTDFGLEVLSQCEKMGIVVDVSHLSEKGFWDVANKASKPFIASHSNANLICSHKRNLTDVQYRTISSSGGIVGISLVAKHLAKAYRDNTPEQCSALETVCNHIEHFLEIDSTALCLGLDFDGTTPLAGLEDLSKVPVLHEALTNRGLDEKVADDVFYNNAFRFFNNALN
ncbi:MAG: membrane dipeptidase [Clostridia bacterium]|nr:membrane dipeptidase [Clostridia bacterium]